MNLIQFVRLVLKHKILLMSIPILMGFLAILLTMNPTRDYASQTVLYTGIASGSSIDMEKSSDFFLNKTAFDNLINIIDSRETKEEVVVRLLSQHLLLDGPDDRYIASEPYFEHFKELIPDDLYKYVKKNESISENLDINNDLDITVPDGINKSDYEQTVANLMGLLRSNSNNFVYEVINYPHPFYSLEAISQVKAERISNSDLVKLKYETIDPGICQQTLAIYNQVCMRKYKKLKESGSDQVVKYFQGELAKSVAKLEKMEQKLLHYNQDNNIINYYEQSKAVAVVREDMAVAYKNKKAELAGALASKQKLEKKLELQAGIHSKNDQILRDKERLGKLKYQIVMTKAKMDGSQKDSIKLKSLEEEAIGLETAIDRTVSELYTYQNSTDGVPLTKVLPDYIDRQVESEILAAEVELMTAQSEEFEDEVKKYAPAGANIKRIEREIGVLEEEYLEILRGLNLAKLRYQDTQLSANLTVVDPPFYPLTPIPSKRKIVIVAVVIFCFIVILGAILFMDFFDDSIKNTLKAEEQIGVPALGMMPKIFKSNGVIKIGRIQERLLEFTMQNLEFSLENLDKKKPKVIVILSTRTNEGKTTIATNIAHEIKKSHKSVLLLSHSFEKDMPVTKSRFYWLYKILGYQDPRNDYNQQFLQPVGNRLDENEYLTYTVDNNFQYIKSYKELNFDGTTILTEDLDYVIIELPSILEVTYPLELIQSSDLVLLVCRSNRLWTKADDNVFRNIKEQLKDKAKLFVNGVELKEVEILMGELPRKRSNSRKKIKNILGFQFYSKSTI
jgi:uncharacterized protein involved in exopolysaccharide biosynthesis/cellulose biosynthesis protein BcsQ